MDQFPWGYRRQHGTVYLSHTSWGTSQGNRVRRWLVLTKCRLNLTLLFRLYKPSKMRVWYNLPQTFAHAQSLVAGGNRAYEKWIVVTIN